MPSLFAFDLLEQPNCFAALFQKLRSTHAIVSSTFSKVVPHAQWRGNGARSPVLSVSFVSFSLRLFCQRKAVKEA